MSASGWPTAAATASSFSRGGLTWTEIDGEPCLELGWLVAEQHRGVGYATEIGRAGLAFVFDKLKSKEVVAFTEVHNHA